MSDDSQFSDFLSNFRSLNSSLASRLAAIPKQPALTEQQQLLYEAQQTAADIESAFQAIELELRHYNYSLKQRASQQLRECKAQFNQQQNTIAQYNNSVKAGHPIGEANTANNMGDYTDSQRAQFKKQRELLLGSHAMLAESNSSLDSTHRVLAETTAVGVDTTLTLQKQREQFMNQREMLHETDSLLGRSKATLRRMQKRIVTNKLMTGAIILAEMGIAALIVYLKYYH